MGKGDKSLSWKCPQGKGGAVWDLKSRQWSKIWCGRKQILESFG